MRVNAVVDNKDEHRRLKLDAKDIENITNALRIYDLANPPGKVHVYDYEEFDKKLNKKVKKQQIELCNINDHLQFMKKRVVNSRKLHSLTTKGSTDPIRLVASVPPSLEQWLNKAYPNLLTDKVQSRQFLRAFPKFRLDSE